MDVREKQLVDFLLSDKKNIALPINERSFEIFGDEKFLDSPEGHKIVSKVFNKYHLNKAMLNTYRVKEPFIYMKTNFNSNDALIIENKDTYGTIRDLLLENKTILGKKFGAVIFGEGRKIQSSFSFMEKEETKDIQNIENFYYFGDIDAEGIDIFNKLKKSYPEYKIIAFDMAYRFLFDNLDKKRDKNKKRKANISYFDVERLNTFNRDDNYTIYELCSKGYILP